MDRRMAILWGVFIAAYFMGKAGVGYAALALGLAGVVGLHFVAWRQPQLLSIDHFNGWYTFLGIVGVVLLFFAFVGDWGVVLVGTLAGLSVPVAAIRLAQKRVDHD